MRIEWQEAFDSFVEFATVGDYGDLNVAFTRWLESPSVYSVEGYAFKNFEIKRVCQKKTWKEALSLLNVFDVKELAELRKEFIAEAKKG